jgi:hypothetical protein
MGILAVLAVAVGALPKFTKASPTSHHRGVTAEHGDPPPVNVHKKNVHRSLQSVGDHAGLQCHDRTILRKRGADIFANADKIHSGILSAR